MRRFIALLAVLAVVGCSDDPADDPFDGPVQMAVDPATNYQETVAVKDSLDKPVEVVLWRGESPSGLSVLQLVTPAYAQTMVNGAPVVGGLVNSVGIGNNPLAAWNPTAVTNENGRAPVWYDPGHIAGESCAEVRYTDGETRMVTDTVCAVVEPGPMDYNGVTGGTIHFAVGDTVYYPLSTFADEHDNPIAFTIEAGGFFAAVANSNGNGLALNSPAAIGDTATVRYVLDGSPTVEVLATVQDTTATGRRVIYFPAKP